MVFSSLTFLFLYLPILIIFYFSIKNIKVKNIILLVFSLIFYAWGEPKYIVLMILSIIISYFSGILIDKYKKYKLVIMVISTILLLSSLLFFKYGDFIVNNINTLFNINIAFPKLSLPIGISFYTFQILSYIIDVYKGETKVQKNIFNLALYVALFPQLIAGPIVRYQTIETEISKRKHSLKLVEKGIKRFILGLCKKVIFANSMAAIVDRIFIDGIIPGTALIWIGAICYTLQIYYDFSGYSDMAIGLGKVFGFNFLENFDSPYISKSITEFWRRWHISLSSWFRDYVYIPLGGSRVSKNKNIRNILVVWALTGLWHGASWNFIIWGLYYCALLLIEKFILYKQIEKLPNILRHLSTIFFVIIGWVIFRITEMNSLLLILKNMFVYTESNMINFILNNAELIINFYMIIPAIIFCIPFKIKYKTKHKLINKIITNSLYIIAYVINIALLASNTYNPFIYFRF